MANPLSSLPVRRHLLLKPTPHNAKRLWQYKRTEVSEQVQFSDLLIPFRELQTQETHHPQTESHAGEGHRCGPPRAETQVTQVEDFLVHFVHVDIHAGRVRVQIAYGLVEAL